MYGNRVKTNKTNCQDIIESDYLNGRAGKMFYCLTNPIVQTDTCIVYFAPLFEERVWAHRVAWNYGRILARDSRISTLFYDYYGYGESDGAAEDFTIAKARENFDTVMELLKEKGFSKICLWGIRTGCRIAIECEQQVKSFKKTIMLWAPVFDLQSYVYNKMLSMITSQLIIYKRVLVKRDEIINEVIKYGQCERAGMIMNTIDGYRFGAEFYKEIINNEKRMDINSVQGSVLSVELLAQESVKLKDRERLKEGVVQEVKGRQFWNLGRDYSQQEISFYEQSTMWLNKEAIWL
jgi:hypothetical protein